MNKQLSRRLDGVSESATLKLNAAVQAMKAQGVDVVNLTAGEPDFWVPEAANVAVRAALDAHLSKYTPVPGIPELRSLVAEKTNRQQPGLKSPWKPAHVIVSNGGKQALFNLFQALLNPGDAVLIPAPYWLSYPEMVKLAGGTPVIVPTRYEDRFKLAPLELKRALQEQQSQGRRVRALILNSPSNPTGTLYESAELRGLGQVVSEEQAAQDLVVVSDEIYDRIRLGQAPFTSFLGACPELQERTVTVNGLSKSAAMTGWRVGWSVAPEWITQGINTLQGQSTSGISALSQAAAVAALKLPETDFAEQIESFRRRRDLTLEILAKAGKMKLLTPDGAFYAFVGVGSLLQPGEDSIGFAERLLGKAKVAVVPGTPFGAPEFIRLSFATDERSLREGCERIARFATER